MQAVSQKSGRLLNPVSHALLCLEPVIKKHWKFWFYQNQSQLSIDFQADGILLNVTWDSYSKNSELSTILAQYHHKLPVLQRAVIKTSYLFRRSRGSWKWTLCMQYGASADKFCFDLSGSLETKVPLWLILNPEEKMLVLIHTEHPVFPPFLILSLHQLCKHSTPAHMGDNKRLRGKLYKVLLGCSLYCETWSHTMKQQPWRDSLLWGKSSQSIIPLVSCSKKGAQALI